MATKITHDKLAEKNVLSPLIKEFNELIKVSEEATKSLKGLKETLDSKKIIESSKALSELSEAIKEINTQQDLLIKTEKKKEKIIDDSIKATKKQQKAAEELTKTQKQRVKLEEDLKQANSDSIQENEELKVQLQEQRKSNKELAKEKLGLISTYEKESKRLNALRKEYKSLRLENGKDTKETEELRKEIQKLDKELKEVDADVGQFNREVGNYGAAVEDAIKSTKDWVVGLGAAGAALELVNTSIKGSEEGSEALRSVQSQLSAAFSVTTNSLFNTASGLFSVTKGLFGAEQTAEEAEEAYAKLTGSFDNFGDRVQTSVKAAKEAEEANIALEKSSRGLREELATINGELEEQNLIAGDTTLSFQAQQEAAEKATRLNIERALILRTIAEEELRIIDKRIEALGEDANSLELLNEQSEKRIELTEIQNELDLAQLDNQKVLREITRDRFEKELDFAIDAFDSTKTLLERQIALEGQSFEQRVDNLAALQELSDSAFESQKQLINQQVGQDIDLDRLILINDEKKVREELIKTNITDEIVLTRILEVYREQRTVTQDIADANLEINAALKEQVKETESVVNELDQIFQQGQIDATEEFETQLDLRKRKLIDQADFEIMQAEENADQIAIIRAQLNNDLAALDREAAKREADLQKEKQKQEEDDRKKRKEENRKLVDEIGSETLEQLVSQSDKREQLLDKEVTAAEESVAQQERIAAEGGENILAQERERLAKAQLEQQRAAEERAKQEQALALALAFVNSFASYSEEDPKTALGKALKDTFLAKGIAKIITGSFYEGTEDTGTTANPMDSKGGRLVMVHDNERIMSKAQNEMTKGMSNDELAKLAQDYHNGNTWSFMPTVAQMSDNSEVVTKLDQTAERIENALKKYQSQQVIDGDSLGRLIDTRIKGTFKQKFIQGKKHRLNW